MSDMYCMAMRSTSSGVRSFCLISGPNCSANWRIELLPVANAAMSLAEYFLLTGVSTRPMLLLEGIINRSTALSALPSMFSGIFTPSIRRMTLFRPSHRLEPFHFLLRSCSCRFLFEKTSAANSDRLLLALALVILGSFLIAVYIASSSRLATICSLANILSGIWITRSTAAWVASCNRTS